MLKYLLPFFMSFCASLVLTPLVRRLALTIGAIDAPGGRKIHRVPTPRLGGIALVLAILCSWLVTLAVEFGFGDLISPYLAGWFPIMLGAGLIFSVGIWDDVHPLPAWVKFLFQTVAAAVAISFIGPVEYVSLMGDQTYELGVFALPLTFLWIIGMTNAFNLIDGLDGLAAGLASIAAGTCAAIFLLRGDAQDAMLLVMLLGALLGFLRYNFNPAHIFLGDSGSLVVGYILAVTAITGSQKGATALAVVVPLLIFGLPILDTLLSMTRRFVGGLRVMQPYKTPLKQRVLAAKRMFEADQAHIHHRLIALGFSHRNAVLTMYGIALGLSVLALLSVLAQFRNAGIILIAVGLATYIGIRKLGYREVTFLRAGTLLRWYEQVAFNRLFFTGFLDLALITLAYWVSLGLKYDFAWPVEVKSWYLSAFPVVLLLQFGVFVTLGLYQGVWRATGIGDLIRMAVAVGAAGSLSYAVVQLSVPPSGVLAFFAIDLLMLAALVAGTRSLYRILDYSHRSDSPGAEGALIYGAGKGGQLVLRELLQNSALGLRPVGFLDDDPSLQQRTVNRVPVLGTSADLGAILTRRSVATVVIASDKIRHDRLEAVLSLCAARRIPVMQAHLKLEPLGPNGNGEQGPSGNGGEPAYPVPADQGAVNRER